MPAPENPPRVEEPQAVYDPVTAGVHAVQQLEQAGFNRPQAESVVLAVRELAGDLVTKGEFDLRIKDIELRIKNLELRMKEMELRLTKAMHKSMLWTVGIIAGINIGAISIAVAIVLDALKP